MTSLRTRTAVPVLFALTLASIPPAALFGCSGTPTNTFGTGGSGGTGSSGTQSSGSLDTSSSSSSGEGGFNIGVGGSGGAGGGGNVGGGCATSSAEATLLPLNMFIAIDTSGSMGDPSDPNNFNSPSKWEVVQQSFTQFFQDPAAADLRVALRFWPDNGCDDNGSPNCSTAIPFCQKPEVDIGPLSDMAQQKALIDALNNHSPNGGTPTSAALQGATKWCANYVIQKNKMEKAVVLLVTDGEPTSCDIDPNNIAKIADIAYQGAGVLTYAVGLAGSNQGTMDQFAMGGHTGSAFMIAPGNMAAQNLLAALKKIQGSALACSFKMPDPPVGQTIDPTKVNVDYSSGGGMPTTIGQVSGPGACGAKGGWYYDNPKSPTTINLCPSTCTTIQSDGTAKIQIVLGCSTQIG